MPVICAGIRSHHTPLPTRGVRNRLCRVLTGTNHLNSPPTATSFSQLRYTPSSARSASSNRNSNEVKHVAVLGGGITGLAAAHYITEEFPGAKVTIFERQPRLGGWLRSTEVDVGDGVAVFEAGPRSLRTTGANGMVMLRLVQALGLTDDLLVVPKSSPAAQNRFLYYPNSLVRLPRPGRIFDNARTFLTEPLFSGTWSAIRNDISTEPRDPSTSDESIGSFLQRRLNTNIVNNLVSAILHGIYAGDVWRLSAKSLLPSQWECELRHDSLLAAVGDLFLKKANWQFCDDLDLQINLRENEPLQTDLRDKVREAGVVSFTKGLGTLTERLVERLKRKGTNVEIRLEEAVHSIVSTTEGLQITSSRNDLTTGSEPTQASHVISTLPPHAVASLLDRETANTLPFNANQPAPAVNVAVVNLYYRNPSLLSEIRPPNTHARHLHPSGLQGFGYLIPNSVPFSENPERALGVIFDSDVTPNLYSTVQDGKRGTRLTVMLGGHWWDGWDQIPSEDECIEMARSVLQRHLGIESVPVAAVANIQRDCIPQYFVGHYDRMQQMHQVFTSEGSPNLPGPRGRLKVAGSWYRGVGVNDCLRSAYDVVQGMKKETLGKGVERRRTGLEMFADSRRPMAYCERAGKVIRITKIDERAKGGRFPAVEGQIRQKLS